jgi:chaperonin GroEL (HSP60 family)
MVSADLGIKLESVTVNMLGHAKKVMIEKENTTIVGGAGKKADIQGRIPQLTSTSKFNSIYQVFASAYDFGRYGIGTGGGDLGNSRATHG